MATEPNPIVDLSRAKLEKKIEEGLKASEILQQQSKERMEGSREFRARVPSTHDGGVQPTGVISPEVKEAITQASEGVSPDAAKALGLPQDHRLRLEMLLERLQTGDVGDPHDLVEMLTGDNPSEKK